VPQLALAGASPVVVRRRDLVALSLDLQLALVELASDLGPLLLVYLGLGDILRRRRVRRGRHLVGVVIIDSGRYPFLLGQAGKLIVIKVCRLAAMLTPVPVELLGWLV
jgi:hypothetical protein